MTNIMFGQPCALTCDLLTGRYPTDRKPGNVVSPESSLNRRGAPMTCCPDGAYNLFYGLDLQPLVKEDALSHGTSAVAGTTET